MRRRRNPFGINLNTVILVGGALFLWSKWPKGVDWNELVGATPVGGTLPGGQPLNYGISDVSWDSFLGVVRAGNLTFHVTLVHQGPADTPTIAVTLGDRQVGAAQINVASDSQNRSYRVDIPTLVQYGVYPLTILVISAGPQGGIALNQAMLQTVNVYP